MNERRLLVLVGAVIAATVTGCGGSTKPSFPTVGAARTYRLTQFRPTGPVRAGTPVTVSFAIRRPDGTVLTRFKRGPGPHTGVHLILVRRDLGEIIHRHPPIGKGGVASEQIVFTKPGPYRVVIDAYPATNGPQPNFQLFGTLRVAGAYTPQPLPAFTNTVLVSGYRFTLHGTPRLRAIEASDLMVTVTDPQGRPAQFTPWFGALAHAIFFRKGSLDYFHTHICAPGATGCTSALGGTKVTGTSSTPGKLTVGVLVPAPGTWRLFLQCKAGGRVLTAPFTLTVH
ncbi:MAG: hypothetical protein QOG80_1793 [Pseudonocardiales bacterium]|nr:hypothetical protein [Pseudonocardiales bacterium]